MIEHSAPVSSVAFSSDGVRLAISSEEGPWAVFEMEEGETSRLVASGSPATAPIAPVPAWASSVAFSPDGRHVATANASGAKVFNSTTGQEVDQLIFGRTSTVTFSPDGRLLATANDDGTARLFDFGEAGEPTIPSRREVARLAHQGPVNSVAFRPDGRLVATTGADNIVRVFESATGKELAQLSHQEWGNVAALGPGGKLLAIHVEEGVRVVHIGSGEEGVPLVHQTPPFGITFSPDGRRVATASPDGTRLFDSATGREVCHLAGYVGVSFTPDGRFVMTQSYDRTVVVESSTGKEVARLAATVGPIAFTRDGRFVATTGETVQVFETATWKEVARLAHQMPADSVAFSPDGRLLAYASFQEGSVLPWRPKDIIEYICSHLPFNLSRKEWEDYLPDESYRKTGPNLP